MRQHHPRRGQRIAGTTAARISLDGATSLALVANLSLDGVCLHGADLPGRGTAIALSLLIPTGWLPVTGHVTWADDQRRAIGVAFDRGTEPQRHALASGMLALAFELDASHPAALLLVDDDRLAAELCEPLRRHGFAPRAIRTPLEAVAWLERSEARENLAIVSARTLELDAAHWLCLLRDSHPGVKRFLIRDPEPGRELVADASLPFDALLPTQEPQRALDALLTPPPPPPPPRRARATSGRRPRTSSRSVPV